MKNSKTVKAVTVTQLLEDLRNGLSRWKKDDRGNGSIQEKYSLTHAEMCEVCKAKGLKNRKVHTTAIKNSNLIIIDDVADNRYHKFELVNRVRKMNELEKILEKMD